MKMLKLFTYTILLVILITFCLCTTIPTQTTGGGTETVNTYVMLSNKKPAKGAMVQLIDGNSWLDSLAKGNISAIQTVIADSYGYAPLRIKKEDSVLNIQIDCINQDDYNDEGLFKRNFYIAELKKGSDTFYLEPYGSYSGKFSYLDSNIALSPLFIYGSTYKASISKNGTFAFNRIPKGFFGMLCIDNSIPHIFNLISTIKIEPNINVSDTGLYLSVNRLLFDNFESRSGPTSLDLLFPDHFVWYGVATNGTLQWRYSTNSWEFVPYPSIDSTCASFVNLGFAAGQSSPSCFRFVCMMDSSCNTLNYAIAGVSLRKINPLGVDFSAMKSFSLKLRGKGLIWIRFETKNLDSITNRISNYTYAYNLQNEWTSLTVPVDSLKILPDFKNSNQFSWLEESKNVMDIEFEFSPLTNKLNDTLFIELDDFYLNGISLMNFLK
jgi:hypothetical protein